MSATYRCLAVALRPQLVALITRPTNSASYWPCSRSTASSSLVKHCVSLVAGNCSYGPVWVGQPLGLDETLAVWQNMSILVKLQSILRSMSESIERRMAHVLRSEVVLMLVDHGRCGEMAERRRVLVESCPHHIRSVVSGLGHNPTSGQQRMGLNGGGSRKGV